MRSDHIPYYLIIILLAALLFQEKCSRVSPGDKNDTTIVNFHKYDNNDHHYHFTIVTPKDSVITTAPAVVDTASIIKWFYMTYVFCDTISDSNMTAVIIETVSQNKIIDRDFTYRWKRPVQITQIVQKTPKNRLYLGLFGGVNGQNSVSLGPEMIIITKKDHAYKLNADLINRGIEAGIHWKISLKKP
jgi:hypothetical protein